MADMVVFSGDWLARQAQTGERDSFGMRYTDGFMGRKLGGHMSGSEYSVTRGVAELICRVTQQVCDDFYELRRLHGDEPADALSAVLECCDQLHIDDDTNELVHVYAGCNGGMEERSLPDGEGRYWIGHGWSWHDLEPWECDRVHDEVGAHARAALSA